MKKLFFIMALASLLMGAELEKKLSAELLAKYYQKETVQTTSGALLDKITISGPPTPPLGIQRTTTSTIDSLQTSSIATLSQTPAFSWSFGCAATSGAMVAGYYDRTGYSNVYTGPTNGGVVPLDNSVWGTMVDSYGDTRAQCPLSATKNGLDGRTTRGHVDDYWIGYTSTSDDPFFTNGWVEHTYGDCTGDYMKTNQTTNYGNSDGSTDFYFYEVLNGAPLTAANMESYGIQNEDGGYGLKLFFESRGYTVTTLYNQRIDPATTGGFTFTDYMAEIDAGHPVLIHVTGHTMVGVGYDSATNLVYLHDTWDYNTYSMTWGGTYSGMDHFAVTVIHLDPTQQEAQNSALPAMLYLLF